MRTNGEGGGQDGGHSDGDTTDQADTDVVELLDLGGELLAKAA